MPEQWTQQPDLLNFGMEVASLLTAQTEVAWSLAMPGRHGEFLFEGSRCYICQEHVSMVFYYLQRGGNQWALAQDDTLIEVMNINPHYRLALLNMDDGPQKVVDVLVHQWRSK